MCSDIPWNGPIACVRVGEVNGQFVVNPDNERQFESNLDLVYVGTEEAALMIEGSADQISEKRFVEALHFAHRAIQPILKAQKELAQMMKVAKQEFNPIVIPQEVERAVAENFGSRVEKAWFQPDRKVRVQALDHLKKEVGTYLVETFPDKAEEYKNRLGAIFEELMMGIFRSNILRNGRRPDGRSLKEVRRLSCEVGVLPKVVHGSALFERGETQSLVTATLGAKRDSQELDALTGGAQSKSFILHYNFPHFSVGEVGRMGATSRRETGHGALAERSLMPVLPSEADFPYSIRLVAETMGSNGSTSMAAVCGGCLSLMDAGVPIVSPVAGISVGLVTPSDRGKHVLLTDIVGDEDHFGDMDFKIAGTEAGITGFQLDLKIAGLSLEIMTEAVAQSREARLGILQVMKTVLPAPRKELSEYAPRFSTIEIPADKIGALIGSGGKTIKRITEVTGSQIDIHEDNSGKVTIFTKNSGTLEKTIEEIRAVTRDIEVGKTYRGIVRTIKEFGVFVECLPGKEGMVHVSELAGFPVRHPDDVCKLGDVMFVKCIGIDDRGRVRLSRKAATVPSF
jgi:polyribonucleotide nucleotidyltransferase